MRCPPCPTAARLAVQPALVAMPLSGNGGGGGDGASTSVAATPAADASSSNFAGCPFALVLPNDWQVPVEYTDVGLAYPDLIGFVGGDAAKQDWYRRPAAGRTKATAPSVWKW